MAVAEGQGSNPDYTGGGIQGARPFVACHKSRFVQNEKHMADRHVQCKQNFRHQYPAGRNHAHTMQYPVTEARAKAFFDGPVDLHDPASLKIRKTDVWKTPRVSRIRGKYAVKFSMFTDARLHSTSPHGYRRKRHQIQTLVSFDTEEEARAQMYRVIHQYVHRDFKKKRPIRQVDRTRQAQAQARVERALRRDPEAAAVAERAVEDANIKAAAASMLREQEVRASLRNRDLLKAPQRLRGQLAVPAENKRRRRRSKAERRRQEVQDLMDNANKEIEHAISKLDDVRAACEQLGGHSANSSEDPRGGEGVDKLQRHERQVAGLAMAALSEADANYLRLQTTCLFMMYQAIKKKWEEYKRALERSGDDVQSRLPTKPSLTAAAEAVRAEWAESVLNMWHGHPPSRPTLTKIFKGFDNDGTLALKNRSPAPSSW